MRVSRPTLLALATALAGACSSSANAPATSTSTATPNDAGLQTMTFPVQAVRDVDVLFVVDDAPGMGAMQDRLRASYAAFTGTLETLPAGPPNLHVAVTSADMGAGVADVPGCRAGGDQGAFSGTPRG